MARTNKKRPRIIEDDDTGDESPVSSPTSPGDTDIGVGAADADVVEIDDDDNDDNDNDEMIISEGVVNGAQTTRRRRFSAFRADHNFLQGTAESIERHLQRLNTRQVLSNHNVRYVRFVIHTTLRFLLQQSSMQLVDDLRLDDVERASLSKYQHANYELALCEAQCDLKTRDDLYARLREPTPCISPPHVEGFPRNTATAKWAERFAKAVDRPDTIGDTLCTWVEKLHREKVVTQKEKTTVVAVIEQISGFLEHCEYTRTLRHKTHEAVEAVKTSSGYNKEKAPVDADTLKAGTEELLRWIQNAQTNATSDVLKNVQETLSGYAEYEATQKKIINLTEEAIKLRSEVYEKDMKLFQIQNELKDCRQEIQDMQYSQKQMQQTQQQPHPQRQVQGINMQLMRDAIQYSSVLPIAQSTQPTQPVQILPPWPAPLAVQRIQPQPQPQPQTPMAGLTNYGKDAAFAFFVAHMHMHGVKNEKPADSATHPQVGMYCYVHLEKMALARKSIQKYISILEDEFQDPLRPGAILHSPQSTRFNGTVLLLSSAIIDAMMTLSAPFPEKHHKLISDAFQSIHPNLLYSYAKDVFSPMLQSIILNLQIIYVSLK